MDPACITLSGYKIWFCTNLDRYKLSADACVMGGCGVFLLLSILQRILLERNYVSSSSLLVGSLRAVVGRVRLLSLSVVYPPPCRVEWSHTTENIFLMYLFNKHLFI